MRDQRVFAGSTPIGTSVRVINASTQRERDRFVGRVGAIESSWTDVVSSGRCEVAFEADGRKPAGSHWFDEHNLEIVPCQKCAGKGDDQGLIVAGWIEAPCPECHPEGKTVRDKIAKTLFDHDRKPSLSVWDDPHVNESWRDWYRVKADMVLAVLNDWTQRKF